MPAADDAAGGLAPPAAPEPVGEGRLRYVTLELTVTSGAHMPKADFTGKCDPFCELEWKEQVFRTTTRPKTYTPEWNETFAFHPHTVRGSPPGAQDALPPLRVRVFDEDEAEKELLGEAELPADLMAQLVLAPNGWTAACSSLHFAKSDGGGLQLKGQDEQLTEVAIAVRVTWTEEEDPDFGLDEEALQKKAAAKKGFTLKVAEDPLERARREREEEARERAERAEAKKRAGPTFFGGGRLGNAVHIEAAARNGENWSKRNAIVLNSDKRREAQLRALAAAETRRVGSSGRLADRQRAAALQSFLTDGSMQVAQALHASAFATHDTRSQQTHADAATRRLRASQSRGRVAQPPRAEQEILPSKKHPAVRIPYHRAPAANSAAADSAPILRRPDSQPAKQSMAHREGLLTAGDIDRYASMNEGREPDSDGPVAGHRAWHTDVLSGRSSSADLDSIRAAAVAVNTSSFLASPRAVHGGFSHASSAYAAGGSGGSGDEEGDDLLARARALIAAGNAVSSAVAGVGGGAGGSSGAEARPREWCPPVMDGDEEVCSVPDQRGADEGEENEMGMLARIRGIAQSILGGDDTEVVEECHEEEATQNMSQDDRLLMQTSFGERLAGMDKRQGGGEAGGRSPRAGWAPFMEDDGPGGRTLAEPSTATLPSVQSRAESDLSANIPLAGRGRGKNVGGGQWGVVEEEEEDGGEQRVVLQGMRLRGLMCGREDNPEISFMLKIDMGGFKCRTDKARRLRGEVAWKDRCELDLVGATNALRLRVLRCRQPRSASQSVDSVVGECEIPVDQLEGSDRAVSWGWHRVLGLGVGGDAAASGEIYLGIERFRVPDAGQEADAPIKESVGTMPDEMLAPDLDDPLSKAGAAAILQRGWRCHAARRATRAILEWRESLQRKSHRAYPGSLKGLQPPSKEAQVAAALGKAGAGDGRKDAKDDQPREGAAAMYSRRRPPAARNLTFGAAPGGGAGGAGARQPANFPGVPTESASGSRGGSGPSLVPMHPADRYAGSAQNSNSGQQFALDALFPLGRSAKGALRLPPPIGVTDARGAGGAADRSWGGGGEGHAGLYGGRGGYGGAGDAPGVHGVASTGSDLGGQWDKIHGAAALLMGTGQ